MVHITISYVLKQNTIVTMEHFCLVLILISLNFSGFPTNYYQFLLF